MRKEGRLRGREGGMPPDPPETRGGRQGVDDSVCGGVGGSGGGRQVGR